MALDETSAISTSTKVTEMENATTETTNVTPNIDHQPANEKNIKNTKPIALINKSKWNQLVQQMRQKKDCLHKASNTSKGVKIQQQSIEDEPSEEEPSQTY